MDGKAYQPSGNTTFSHPDIFSKGGGQTKISSDLNVGRRPVPKSEEIFGLPASHYRDISKSHLIVALFQQYGVIPKSTDRKPSRLEVIKNHVLVVPRTCKGFHERSYGDMAGPARTVAVS